MKVSPHLQQWLDEGWLRPIDAAFAGLLTELGGETDERVLEAAALTSFHLGAGHVCMDIKALLENPGMFLPGLSLKDGEPVIGWKPFVESLQSLGLKKLLQVLQHSKSIGSRSSGSNEDGNEDGNDDNAQPLVLDGHRLYLRRYWAYEKQVAAALIVRMRPLPSMPNVDETQDLRSRLDELFVPQDNEVDWQRIAAAITSQQRFAVISGGPGTGKTTTVVKLLSLLQGLALSGQGRALRIALAAPTGKAAARLTESIGGAVARLPHHEYIPTQVTTLHRLLGARPDTREFVRHRGNPLHVDILVIDEASMVDLEMMAAVVDALPAQARLILLGDKDQLASVEAGAILGEICRDAHLTRYSPALCQALQARASIHLNPHKDAQALDDHIITLKKSHRFSAQGGIGRLALAINEGDTRTALKLLDGNDAQVSFLRKDSIDGGVKTLVLDTVNGYVQYLMLVKAGCPAGHSPEQWASAVLHKLGGFQILCALRQGPFGVDALNQQVAHLLQEAGWLSQTQGWYAGRPVMVTRNDYALGLMNGDVGITLPDATANGALRVFFAQPEGIKRVLPSRLTQVDTVFAMTVHKSQGSEFTHTCLVLPNSVSPVLTRELIYTAVTRAKQRVTLLGQRQEVLEIALKQRVFRCSGLWERLSGN